MTQAKLYGISNCDTVRKAKKWLDAQGVSYTFIDFRKDGMKDADVSTWVSKTGLEKILNKRGTTWRKLDPAKQDFPTEHEAIKLLLAEPTLIKRPILEIGDHIEVGFSESTYSQIF